jgi:integrating conjugative element protein (TIGR03759 family)
MVVFLCLSGLGANAQVLVAPTQKDIQYSPTKTTAELLERYSRVYATPNAYWQLTEEEWARYEVIKAKSPWSVWENHASPLALLFHYASSMEEKRRYARIEAELDTWRQHTVIEFQTLYGKERAIVHARYVDAIKDSLPVLANIRPHDKLRVFFDAGNCDARCRSVVTRLLVTQAKIDIYIKGASNDEAIFAWATSASVPVERVKTKEITLNHENGLLDIVAKEAGIPFPRIPCAFKQGSSGIQVVAL